MGRVERVRVEIEGAEVKVDGVVEALPIPVTASHSLDPLDLRIYPLTSRVGDVGRRCIDHSIPVVLDQPCHALDRLQTRTDRPVTSPSMLAWPSHGERSPRAAWRIP